MHEQLEPRRAAGGGYGPPGGGWGPPPGGGGPGGYGPPGGGGPGGYGPPGGGPPGGGAPGGGGWGPPPDPFGPPPGGGFGPPPGAMVHAPYGVHPITGVPFSDKSKVVAGLLQIFVPFGVGRFYTGHTNLGIIQAVAVVLTCGVAALWPMIDGVMMLMGNVPDSDGRPLREGV